LFSLSSLLVLFCLVACSGDDVKVELTGQVDRNFSAGMTICLDSSGNGVCDPDEPSALVNADGSYTVTVPAESLGNFPLLVESVNKAKGKSITLSAPADNSRFISPISTAVQNRVFQGSSLAEAEANIRRQYTLPADIDIYADYQDGSLEPETVRVLSEMVEGIAADYGIAIAETEEPAEVAEDSQRVAVRRGSGASRAVSADSVAEEEAGSIVADIGTTSSDMDSGFVTPGSVVAATAERSILAGSSGNNEKNAMSSSTDNSDKDSQADGSHEEEIDKNDSHFNVSGTGNLNDNSGKSNGSGTGDPGDNSGNSDTSDNFMSISAIQLDVLKIEACADEGGCTVASGPMQLDLLELADGKVDFANKVLLPDNTKELRLILSENNTITADGISSALTVPSGQTSGLKLKGQQIFSDEGGFLASITLNLDLEKALVVQGKKNKSKGKGKKTSSNDDAVYSFKLKPVIKVGTAKVTPLPEGVVTVVALPDEDVTLTLGDDFSLFIPAGAVSEATIITAEETKYFVEVKDGVTGDIVKKPGLASTYELSPDGAQFAEPLQVAIHYHNETLPQQLSEENLAIFHDGDSIPTNIDTKLHVAKGDILHFTGTTVAFDYQKNCTRK
jgi:hypothetical protein